MQQQILNLLIDQEEVGWKQVLFDLVESEKMDPWDIDVSLLTQKYIEAVHKMQEHDLKISGKVLLAAAMLLKMKSTYFLDKDIADLDRLMNPEDYIEEEDWENLTEGEKQKRLEKLQYALIPRNPQPRTRKVSIHDLVKALQHALETKKRILAQQRPVPFKIPERKVDIMEVLRDVYHKIVYYSEKEEKALTFTQLLPPRAGKAEKVYTFIPLLHLENLQKVETSQAKPFDEIYVKLVKKNAVSA
ncbi:segregation/condensation protein A [Candidatus Woesearchaeota archaeon]|nr:segregation/condensation protein A [Candidatus Woesearchaeota archaeon]